MTYDEMAQMLGGRPSKVLPNIRGTILRRDGDNIALSYWGTDVVTWHPDGGFTLRSGGWYTVTTKARINAFTPVSVRQRQHEWFVTTPDGVVPFRDGMRIGG